MTNPDENPVLVAVATTIADGHPVDWESLKRDHPDLAGELEGLRLMQDLEGASKRAGKGSSGA